MITQSAVPPTTSASTGTAAAALAPDLTSTEAAGAGEDESISSITITSVKSIAVASKTTATVKSPQKKNKQTEKNLTASALHNQLKKKRKSDQDLKQDFGPPKKKAKLKLKLKEPVSPKKTPKKKSKAELKAKASQIKEHQAPATSSDQVQSSNNVVPAAPASDRKRSRKQQIAIKTYDDINPPSTTSTPLKKKVPSPSKVKRKYTKKPKAEVGSEEDTKVLSTASSSSSLNLLGQEEPPSEKKPKSKVAQAKERVLQLKTLIRRSRVTLKRSQLLQFSYKFTIFHDPSRDIACIGPGQCLIDIGTLSESCDYRTVDSKLGGLAGPTTKPFQDYLSDPYFVQLKEFWKQSTLPFTRIVRFSSLEEFCSRKGISGRGIDSKSVAKTFRFFGDRYQKSTVESENPRTQTFPSNSLVIKHNIYNYYNKNPVLLPFIVLKKIKYRGKLIGKPVLKIVKLKRAPGTNNIEIFVEEESLPLAVGVANVAEMTERHHITPIINTPSAGLLPLIPNKPSDLQALQLLAQQQRQLQLQSQVHVQELPQQQQQHQFDHFNFDQNQHHHINYIRYEPQTATEFVPVLEVETAAEHHQPPQQINGFVFSNNCDEIQVQVPTVATASQEYFGQVQVQEHSQGQHQQQVIILPAELFQQEEVSQIIIQHQHQQEPHDQLQLQQQQHYQIQEVPVQHQYNQQVQVQAQNYPQEVVQIVQQPQQQQQVQLQHQQQVVQLPQSQSQSQIQTHHNYAQIQAPGDSSPQRYRVVQQPHAQPLQIIRPSRGQGPVLIKAPAGVAASQIIRHQQPAEPVLQVVRQVVQQQQQQQQQPLSGQRQAITIQRQGGQSVIVRAEPSPGPSQVRPPPSSSSVQGVQVPGQAVFTHSQQEQFQRQLQQQEQIQIQQVFQQHQQHPPHHPHPQSIRISTPSPGPGGGQCQVIPVPLQTSQPPQQYHPQHQVSTPVPVPGQVQVQRQFQAQPPTTPQQQQFRIQTPHHSRHPPPPPQQQQVIVHHQTPTPVVNTVAVPASSSSSSLPPVQASPKKPKKPRKSKKSNLVDVDTSCQLQAAPTFPPSTTTTAISSGQSQISAKQQSSTPTPATLVRVSQVSQRPTEGSQAALKSYPSSAVAAAAGSVPFQNNRFPFPSPAPPPKSKAILIVKQAPATPQQQGPASASTSTSSSTPSTSASINRPVKKEGFAAVCPHCGLCTENLIKCARCRLEFPVNVKLIPLSWGVGTNEKVVAVGVGTAQNQMTSSTKADSNSGSDKDKDKQGVKSANQITSSVPVKPKKILLVPNGRSKAAIPFEVKIQPDGSTLFIDNTNCTPTSSTAASTSGKRTPGTGLKRRAPQRKKEQECITLSSDDEPEPEPPKVQKVTAAAEGETKNKKPEVEMPKKPPTTATPTTPTTNTVPVPPPTTPTSTTPTPKAKASTPAAIMSLVPKPKISLNVNLSEPPPSSSSSLTQKKEEESTEPPIVLKRIQQKMEKTGSEAVNFSFCTVEARSIRIGSYKVTDRDSPIMTVSLTELGIICKVPHCDMTFKKLDFCIPKESIIRFRITSQRKLCAIFLNTGPKFAQWARTLLGMEEKPKNESANYFSPLDGSLAQRMICFLFNDQFKAPDLGLIRNMYKDVCEEMSYKDADNLLMRLTPLSYQSSIAYQHPDGEESMSPKQQAPEKDKSEAAVGMKMPTSTNPTTTAGTPPGGEEGVPRIVSTMSVKSMVKEEPKEEKEKCDAGIVLMYEGCNGKVSVSPKDITCLGFSQFLNDQIIDLWFSVILTEKLSEEDRKRTFVFDSFFYGKLTEKMKRKTAEDGTLTAAERRHARVKKRTKNVDLFEKDFLIVPINENYHWFLAIICFPGLQGYHDYDTLKPLPDYKPPPKVKAPRKTENSAKTKVNKPIKSNQVQNPSTAAYSSRDEAPEDPDEVDEGNESSPETDNDNPEQKTERPQPQEQGSSSSDDPSLLQRVKHPCIIIFDSLAGEARGRIYSTLREYLKIEYKTKKGLDREFNKDTMPGCMPKVPQQPNFSDCGLFMLQYVEHFFSSPPPSFVAPAINLRQWFEPQDIALNKRKEIYNFIKDKTKEKSPLNLKYIPEVSFEGDPNAMDLDHDIFSITEEDELMDRMMMEDEDGSYNSEDFEDDEDDSEFYDSESSEKELFVPIKRKKKSEDEDRERPSKSKSAESKVKSGSRSYTNPNSVAVTTVTTSTTASAPVTPKASGSSSTTSTWTINTSTPTRLSYVAVVKKNV